MQNILKKLATPIRKWGAVIYQLFIKFRKRVPQWQRPLGRSCELFEWSTDCNVRSS